MRTAKNEPERCTAFGNRDRRRCRLKKRDGEKTCWIHRNYYADWISLHDPSMFYRESWGNLTDRCQEEFIFQINGGHVQVSASHIKDLHAIQVGFYEVYIRYTEHSPILNKSCFVHALNRLLIPFESVPPISELAVYMKDPACCLFLLSYLFQKLIRKCPQRASSFFSHLWRYVGEDNPHWKQILFCEKIKDVVLNFAEDIHAYYNIQLTGNFMQETENTFRMFVHAFNRMHALTVKNRCEIYKEELIAAAWHPRRLERWLEMGASLDEISEF